MLFKLKYINYPGLILLLCFSDPAFSQTLQMHYEFRHSLDPGLNIKNYPSLVFKEWKSQDYGSFDFESQIDFTGDKNSIGQIYVQIQQSLNLWRSPFSAFFEYSGGVGFVDQGGYGYHIDNAFSVGGAFLFFWQGAWFNTSLVYKYSDFIRASHDPMLSQYWGKNFFNDKVTLSGDFEVWSENKNHGDPASTNQVGKRVLFYGEPQLWYNLNKRFSVGTKVNLYYHVITYENSFRIYPTIAVSYAF